MYVCIYLYHNRSTKQQPPLSPTTIHTHQQTGYRVYAVDLLGFGASDKEKSAVEYELELWRDLLVDFMGEVEVGFGGRNWGFKMCFVEGPYAAAAWQISRSTNPPIPNIYIYRGRRASAGTGRSWATPSGGC